MLKEVASGVYVLHCFQKKSKHGIETPKKDIDLIKQRLAKAIDQDRDFRSRDYPKQCTIGMITSASSRPGKPL
jgi:hypothetical protein